MMDKVNTTWHSISDPGILKVLGNFIRQTRLQQNKTQQQVAADAGINRSTIVQIENGGGGTMLSFIQIVRALGQLQLFQAFDINPQISPLQLAKIEQKKRQRASKNEALSTKKPKSDW